MNKKCANKLAFRWGVLAFVVSELLLVGYWRLWNMPTAETIRYNGGTTDVWQVPLVLPRLVDALVVAVSTFFVFRMFFYRDSLYKWYTNRTNFDANREARQKQESETKDSLECCLVVGVFFGVCGSVIIAATGFVGLAIGTAVCSVLTLVAASESTYTSFQKFYITDAVACLVIWGLNSLYGGVVAGTLYGLSALAISAATFFGLQYGLLSGRAFFTGTFRRTMLSCDVDSTDC
jgi:hypothetical protein